MTTPAPIDSDDVAHVPANGKPYSVPVTTFDADGDPQLTPLVPAHATRFAITNSAVPVEIAHSGVRVELESGGALVIDLDSNLYTDGDPNLVVLSFNDGITTAQLITVSRSAARELGAVLATMHDGESSEPDNSRGLLPVEQGAPVDAATRSVLARAGNLMGWSRPSTARPEYDVPVDPMDALQCDSCQ